MAFVIGTICVHAIPARREANSSLEVGPETLWHAKNILLVATCKQNGQVGFIAAVERSDEVRIVLIE
jgi:hypothetical protein